MKITYAPFNVADYLDNDAVIAAYLSAAAEDPNPAVLAAAFEDVAKAHEIQHLRPTAKDLDTSVPQEHWDSLPLEGRAGEPLGREAGKEVPELETKHQADAPMSLSMAPQGGGDANGKYRSELSTLDVRLLS